MDLAHGASFPLAAGSGRDDKLQPMLPRCLAFGVLVAMLAACAGTPAPTAVPVAPARRVPASAFLRMPSTASGTMPALLSQTGAFADVSSLKPADGLLPYDLVLSFWSDGAAKSRLVAIPEGRVAFSATGEWTFPAGTVFVKTFERGGRRLETRLLVIGREAAVYGVTYRWRADQSDADLLPPEALLEAAPEPWYFPGREDCLTCHNAHTQGALGPKTRQLNRELRYPDGVSENQLRHWNRLGLFEPALEEKDLASFQTLARGDDPVRSLEDRARSWLDVNCAHCHRPGGTVARFDARFETPLSGQQLIDGSVLIDQGLDRARVFSPHDPWRSMALLRVDTNDDLRMPPLARTTIDVQGAALLREWVLSLPGREVVAPPSIEPADGTFALPINVTLSGDGPQTEIRYTLDGSAPGLTDPLYTQPIRIESSAVLRARAFRKGLRAA